MRHRFCKFAIANRGKLFIIEPGSIKDELQYANFNTIMKELENYSYDFSGLLEKSYNRENVIFYANALFCKKPEF